MERLDILLPNVFKNKIVMLIHSSKGKKNHKGIYSKKKSFYSITRYESSEDDNEEESSNEGINKVLFLTL